MKLKETSALHPKLPAITFLSLVKLIPWQNVVICAILGVLIAVANLLQPAAVGIMIQSVSQGKIITIWVFILILAIFGATILTATQTIILDKTGEIYVKNVREKLIHSLFYAPISHIQKIRPGDYVSQVVSEAGSTKIFVTQGLAGYLNSLIILVGAMVCMASINILLLSVTMLVIVFSLSLISKLAGKVKVASQNMQKTIGTLAADVERIFTSIRLIRLTDSIDRENTRILKSLKMVQEKAYRVGRIMGMVVPISNAVFQLALLTVLSVGGAIVASQALAIDQFVSFLLYLFMALMPLNQLFSAFASVNQVKGTMIRLNEIINLPNENCVNSTASSERLEYLNSSAVAVIDVSFGHDNNIIINDVNFIVYPGEFIAIAGDSGVGKSTLLEILCGFYKNYDGNILLFGDDISSMNRSDISKLLSVVEQGGNLIDGTIYENMTMGNLSLSEEEALEWLQILGLAELVSEVSDLQKPVGNLGVQVSGGERQRISLARALASEAPILILDEVTANLDPVSENYILNAIQQFGMSRTVLFVTHHINVIKQVDRVMFMQNGTVRSVENHYYLYENSAEYRNFIDGVEQGS